MNNTYIVLISLSVFVVLAFILARRLRPEKIFKRLGAHRVLKSGEYFGILDKLRSVAKEQRLPAPSLWVIDDFSPNILMLRRGKKLELGFSQGLVSLLNERELDLIVRMAMVHGWSRGRSLHSFWGALVSPVVSRFARMPLSLKILLFPVLFFLVRLPMNRRSVFYHDQVLAQSIQARQEIAALLQKIAVMQDKIPPRHWNLAFDSLYLVPPWGSETHFFGMFLRWPSVLERRERLLGQ